MGKRFLIDSNTLIEYLAKTLPANGQLFTAGVIDEEFNISFINKIEVLGHPSAGKEITAFINLANVFDVTNAIIDKTIEIRKTYKTKIPDALIAATALVYDLTLISRNLTDFAKIQGLQVLNPHSI
jgi:predicted nucleic acid-binding protein